MMTYTCTVALRLRQVVTSVTKFHGRVLSPKDFPPGAHYEMPAIAVILGIAPKTARNLVSALRDKLDPPQYRQRRRNGDFRRRRILSEHDLDCLRAHLGGVVKPIV